MFTVTWFDEKHQREQSLAYPEMAYACLVASALFFAMGIRITVSDPYQVIVSHKPVTEVTFPV